MNRQQRRVIAAMNRKMGNARSDGRPLYFDIPPGERVQCYHCIRNGLKVEYTNGQAFMNDPANSPDPEGGVFTVCLHHIPEDAVIFNPGSGACRNKSGDHTWVEESKH